MIDSLFEELPPISEDEMNDPENLSEAPDYVMPEDLLLATLPTVKIIVHRRTFFSVWHSEASDLVQGVILRLIKWRHKYREKSEEMSPDEWQSFAARTAYNEINRHYSGNSLLKDAPLEEASGTLSHKLLEGESDAEVASLLQLIWQKICCLSLRQRRALILSNHELINYLLKCGISGEQLANSLALNLDGWADVKERLPLSDIQIAELVEEPGKDSQKSIERIAKSIKKARHEARLKLRRLIENE